MVITITASHQIMPADLTSDRPYNILTINGVSIRYNPAHPNGLIYLAIAKLLGL